MFFFAYSDQSSAMARAIRTTLKHTRHRWCRWHVLKKAKQKLGNAYTKYSGFKKEFNKLVTDETCKDAFELKWSSLIRKYNLRDNEFLKRLFYYRRMWAKPYFMDVFCAGMTSTQRSESANHMLKQIIQREAPMHEFVAKFNELQISRTDDEGKQIHNTKLVSTYVYVILKYCFYFFIGNLMDTCVCSADDK